MRVVTGDASDASVSLSFLPAAAVLQPIGAKANIQPSDPDRAIRDDILPGAMARATKVHRLDGIQPPRVQDGGCGEFVFPGAGRGDLGGARPVTSLTRHAGNEGLHIKSVLRRRGSGVTAETPARLCDFHAASCAFRRLGGVVRGCPGVMSSACGAV